MYSKRFIGAGIAGIVLFFGVIFSFWLFENLDSGEIIVIQDIGSGNLHAGIVPGVYWQGLGSVTTYQRRRQTEFKKIDGYTDASITVRFNDGGHAQISGLVSWQMPLDPHRVLALHRDFRSMEAIEEQLIKPAIIRALYNTAPLMSSTESYASRRNEFLQLFEDQLRHGVYLTRTVSTKQPDPVTGQPKTVSVVVLVRDTRGNYVRQEASTLQTYGLTILPTTISRMEYDTEVENQIKAQRDATLQVQTARTQAIRAEQDAITAQKRGEANAATAKWQQEVVKARAVTFAQQQKEVAELNAARELEVARLMALAAAQTKQQQILLGEGEAERKRLVMAADGALQMKLTTYERVSKMYADAIGSYQGAWVPSVIMGGANGSRSGSGAQEMIDLLTARTARDLSLDLSVPGRTARQQ